MADKPIGERVTAVEVSLRDHIKSCEKKHEKAFRVQLVVLTAVIGALLKLYGVL